MTSEPAKAKQEASGENSIARGLKEVCAHDETRLAGQVAGWLMRWRWPLLLALLAFVFCEAAWLTFLTPGEADIAHYECYGLTFWLGSPGASLLPQVYCSFLPITTPVPAFHMLPLEYPPLTIVLFSLPLLAPLPDYALVFALLMTLGAGLIYWLLARSDARRAAPIFLLYLLLGVVGVFQERFDVLPSACVLLCLLAATRGRWRLAYIALAFGVLFKLYPLVMLPALFLAEQRAWLSRKSVFAEWDSGQKRPRERVGHALEQGQEQNRGEAHSGQIGHKGRAEHASWPLWAWENIRSWNWTNSLLCVGLLVVVMGVFARINFTDAILSPLSYFLTRPPQIEALVGSFIWLGGHMGAPYAIDFGNGSLNITSGLTRLLSPVDTALTIAGILAVFWLQWRKRIDLAQSLTGLVCVLIVTGKVFSPQYLIWLIPLLAYISARGQTNRLWMVAWAVISLLTTLIYIFYYSHMPDPLKASLVVQTLPGFFELVALRNLLLAVTTVAFFFGWWGVRGTARVQD
ncbi:MAG TPA: glycosyltransferase family 87 protein [Ktedonobacteraceae bacterium]